MSSNNGYCYRDSANLRETLKAVWPKETGSHLEISRSARTVHNLDPAVASKKVLETGISPNPGGKGMGSFIPKP